MAKIKRKHPDDYKADSIQDVLNQFIALNRLEKGLDKVEIKELWKEVMGATITKYTSKIELRGDVLFVAISNDVLRQELSYGLQKIIQNINTKASKTIVRKLILR